MTRWLELAYEFDSENFSTLHNVEILSNNGISIVMRADNKIYKRSIPYFIENELWMLNQLQSSTFVPSVERFDKYTLRIQDLGISEPVTNIEEFNKHGERLKYLLQYNEIRHGDITPPNVIVKDNHPFLIDWAEARLMNDPRPDKRPPNDVFWIDKTWKEIIGNNVDAV